MIERNTAVHAESSDFGRAVNLYFYRESGAGSTEVLRASFILAEVEEGSYREPSMALQKEAAQRLFDALWSVGFRSRTDDAPTNGHLDALNAHIKDLRYVANRLVEHVTKPEEFKP